MVAGGLRPGHRPAGNTGQRSLRPAARSIEPGLRQVVDVVIAEAGTIAANTMTSVNILRMKSVIVFHLRTGVTGIGVPILPCTRKFAECHRECAENFCSPGRSIGRCQEGAANFGIVR